MYIADYYVCVSAAVVQGLASFGCFWLVARAAQAILNPVVAALLGWINRFPRKSGEVVGEEHPHEVAAEDYNNEELQRFDKLLETANSAGDR